MKRMTQEGCSSFPIKNLPVMGGFFYKLKLNKMEYQQNAMLRLIEDGYKISNNYWDLYVKLAELFLENGRNNQSDEIKEETLYNGFKIHYDNFYNNDDEPNINLLLTMLKKEKYLKQ